MENVADTDTVTQHVEHVQYHVEMFNIWNWQSLDFHSPYIAITLESHVDASPILLTPKLM